MTNRSWLPEGYQPLDLQGHINALAKIKAGGTLADEGWASFPKDFWETQNRQWAIDASVEAGLLTADQGNDLVFFYSAQRPDQPLQDLRIQVTKRAEELKQKPTPGV